MSTRLLLQELTREEARTAAPEALAVFPVGATEQHGPHLPVYTDSFTVEHIARAAAAEAATQIPVLVTPTMPFGSSHHHLPFGGTMSLDTETYFRVIYDLAESLITGGFRRIFILNGHGGNHELIQLVARDLALHHPANVAAASYWTVAWDALIEVQAHAFGRFPGHAGVYETSHMLALRPDLVRTPLPHRDVAGGTDPRALMRPYRGEVHGFWQGINGFTDSPDRADADRGRTYLAAAAGAVAKAFVEFYQVGLTR
ncbi:MAG: creatininase family protein [Armatimonadota bacterium]